MEVDFDSVYRMMLGHGSWLSYYSLFLFVVVLGRAATLRCISYI